MCRRFSMWLLAVVVSVWAGCNAKPESNSELSNESKHADAAKGAGSRLVELVKVGGNARRAATYQQLQDRIARDPQDLDAQLDKIKLLSGVAVSLVQKAMRDQADIVFKAAAEQADSFPLEPEASPPSVRRLMARVYYNDACSHALGGELVEAANGIDHAVQWGFDNFEQLYTDEDLESLRSSVDLDQKMSEWKEIAKQATFEQGQAELARGTTFPFDFSVSDMTGQELNLADFQGKVVVVDLWGTWCPPCRREIPAFIKLQDDYGSQGLQVIGLSFERVRPDLAEKLVSEFVAEMGINYPCGLGTEEIESQIPDFRVFPTTLFIDRTGNVRLKTEGARGHEYLESVVVALLHESQANAIQ